MVVRNSPIRPTTHALPRTHRQHLIQSTRKLGALLGETSLLLEPCGYHSANTSISSISSVDSGDSIASKRSGRIYADALHRARRPSPLSILTLYQLCPPVRARVTWLSHFPSFPISPMTPTFVVDRRKTMAKLVRTLGTNVPPDLVFSACIPLVQSPYTRIHRRPMLGSNKLSTQSQIILDLTIHFAHH
ncbi:hypothetical protein B0H19DRAFT_1268681 [Mycena capillaripes]|nr:hypothetical protein B0H19DRAFT_1268681 [Mycena capillaripes]